MIPCVEFLCPFHIDMDRKSMVTGFVQAEINVVVDTNNGIW